MKPFVATVAASVVASAAVYLVLAVTEVLSLPARLAAMALVLVLGVAIAWMASGDGGEEPGASGIAVGEQIEAKGDIAVERVDIENAHGNARVGTKLKSGDTVRINDVRIGNSEDPE